MAQENIPADEIFFPDTNHEDNTNQRRSCPLAGEKDDWQAAARQGQSSAEQESFMPASRAADRLFRTVNNGKGFCRTVYTTIAVRNGGVKVEAVAFGKNNDFLAIAKFKLAL